MRKAGLSIGRGEAVGFFVLAYGGGGVARCFLRGDFAFGSAYSGGVFSKTFEGGISFTSAYSGFILSMTIEGVSFRTGLRG